jgi:hypothetical protein
MLRSAGWFRTDVSDLVRSPETSVRNQPTQRDIPENDRIQTNSSESLRSHKNTAGWMDQLGEAHNFCPASHRVFGGHTIRFSLTNTPVGKPDI